MKSIRVLKDAFTNKLRGTISHNLSHYKQEKPWLGDFAGSDHWELETNLVPAEPLKLLEPSGENLRDIENAIRMYKSLPSLTPVQARDPRLWTRLTHVELWSYMRKRWPIERHMVADKERAVRFVETRYFVTKAESRALLRNGAARLWWSAKVSHDASRDNPYELTGVLLSTLDITQQILERNLGRAPAVVHGFLEFLRIEGDKLLTGGDKNRGRIRRLAKFLNLSGGVCILDSLSESEIIAMLHDEYAIISAEDATAG